MKRILIPTFLVTASIVSGCIGSGSVTPVQIDITGLAYVGIADPAYLLSPALAHVNDPARVESQLYLGVDMNLDGSWVNQGASCNNPDPLQVSFSLPMSLDATNGLFAVSGPMPQHQDAPSNSHAPGSCSTARDGIHINELQKLKLEIWFHSTPEICAQFTQARCGGAPDQEECQHLNKVWACPYGMQSIIHLTGAEIQALDDEIQTSGTMTISTDLVFEPKDPNEISL